MRRHASVLATVLVVGALAGCADDDPDATSGDPSPSDTASSSPSPSDTGTTESPSPSDEATTGTPPVTSLVYYLVDDPQGIRIAREPHELSAETPLKAAIEAMIAGPDDPDYASTWDPDTKVLGISTAGNVITVDLSEEARTNGAGSDAAMRMVQQLVYTVTEVMGADKRVMLRIEGEPAGDLWGSVSWTRPVRRDPPMAVRNLVQIDFPAEGGTSGRKLTVSGEAATFEATVPWRVVDANGEVVRSGFTTAEEGMTLSPYSFSVRLRPGTYTVEVSEDDASGGEGTPPRTDNRSVTIG